jgi:hypothetical protein
MNIVAEINELFMNVEMIEWIEESIIRSEYDLQILLDYYIHS